MLLLRAQIGGEEVLINAKDVAEVLPYVSLRERPGKPWRELDYHGRSVPIVDLAALCGAQAAPAATLTTRIILLRRDQKGSVQLIGVIAERVTETMTVKHLEALAQEVPPGTLPVHVCRDDRNNVLHVLDHGRVVQEYLA